jgi:hypothetical protein
MMFKKIISIFICLVVITGISVSTAAKNENIIENPSFEEAASNEVNPWYKEAYNKDSNATQFNVSDQNPHSGKKCVVVDNKVENDSRYMQVLKVSSKANYKLSCWIRTENVGQNAKGANLSIGGCLDLAGDIRGTNGKWEYAEMYAKVGKGIDSINVSVGVGGYGSINTGKAWFDDVKVEKVKKIPDGAIVAVIEKQEAQSSDTSTNGTNSGGGSATILGVSKAVWIAFMVGIGLIIACYSVYRKSIAAVPHNDNSENSSGMENTVTGDETENKRKTDKKANKSSYIDRDFEADDE